MRRYPRLLFKPVDEGVYLHVFNHTVSLAEGQRPLGKLEKSKLIHIFEKYLIKYNIELISLVIMGNHFHVILYCPETKFTSEEALNAYTQFHRNSPLPPQEDPRIKAYIKHSNDISELMRETQREFSVWFNKSRPYQRRGALWQHRFQCQLIQSDLYLWSCLQYVEMNPVRAKMTERAEDYPYSSFGRWINQGRHPYGQNFLAHIISLADNPTDLNTFKQFMQQQLKRIQTLEDIQQLLQTGQKQKALALQEQMQREEQETIQIHMNAFARKDWMSGKIIGSEEFIREKYRQWQQYKSSA